MQQQHLKVCGNWHKVELFFLTFSVKLSIVVISSGHYRPQDSLTSQYSYMRSCLVLLDVFLLRNISFSIDFFGLISLKMAFLSASSINMCSTKMIYTVNMILYTSLWALTWLQSHLIIGMWMFWNRTSSTSITVDSLFSTSHSRFY